MARVSADSCDALAGPPSVVKRIDERAIAALAGVLGPERQAAAPPADS